MHSKGARADRSADIQDIQRDRGEAVLSKGSLTPHIGKIGGGILGRGYRPRKILEVAITRFLDRKFLNKRIWKKNWWQPHPIPTGPAKLESTLATVVTFVKNLMIIGGPFQTLRRKDTKKSRQSAVMALASPMYNG